MTIGDLPSSLESLAITFSVTQINWFQPLSESRKAILPHLKELDLSRSVFIQEDDLGHIARTWPGLSTLKLNYCSFATDEGLQSIAEGLHQLEVLEMAKIKCNDVVIEQICQNTAATLRRLNVARCWSVTDQCVGRIATTLINLQSLDVSNCHQLSRYGLLSLVQLNRTLRYLNVSETTITIFAQLNLTKILLNRRLRYLNLPTIDIDDKLPQLTSSLPACNIVCEAPFSLKI